MEDKSKKQEELASQLNNRLLQQLEENIKLIEELESQRDFNNTLIQSTSVFFVAIEANGKLLMMNDPMLKALGYTKKEVLGKDYLTTFVPTNERNKLSKIFEKLSRLHQRTFNENHVLAKDGRLLLVEWHGAPILKGKEFDYFIGLGIDITERKQAEDKIRESQQRLSSHLHNTPLGAIFWDVDFKVTDWNNSAKKIFGYSKEEALGKHANELIIPKEIQVQIENVFNHLLTQTGGEKITNENITKEGKRILCDWYNDVLTDLNGKVTGVASLIDDITDKKKMTTELIKAKEKAEELHKLKSNFLSNMSHELRTPMVGILGFIEILENEIEKPELQKYATFIHEAGNRLMESLNLILNLTKIETKKMSIELSKIDVIKNIKKTKSTFDKMAADKNIYLIFESTVEQLEAETDEKMFDQIINNLVNNAVKFTEKGGVTVSVNKIRNKSYLEIKVKDTGIGIPKDKQEIIWEEFRQVSEGTERVFEGIGLGLTITNNFVNQLGGEIKLKSELGKGSTFAVLLPIREKSISTKTKEPAFDKITETPKTKDRQEELKTLLYFEDDMISREVIHLFLRGRYKVECVISGEEGIEKAKEKKYDGILMNINLQSKMTGITAAEKIKEMEEYKDVPIIAVTAYAMFGDREKYLKAGFTNYISKPFSKNDIIELLDNFWE
ncbi:MAG: PAS domain S-box protein [Bacteroidetes bacterium]|nr:PAS domain S-box protein [Bacteroidota bacterium]